MLSYRAEFESADDNRRRIPVLALVGGRAGAFGGGGIITAGSSGIVVSEHARVSVSGREVIETNEGVEEFDSRIAPSSGVFVAPGRATSPAAWTVT